MGRITFDLQDDKAMVAECADTWSSVTLGNKMHSESCIHTAQAANLKK